MSPTSLPCNNHNAELTPYEFIGKYCSEVMHGYAQMINDRNFSPHHPFWTANLSPTFTVSSFDASDAVDLPTYLENFDDLIKETWPDFYVEMGEIQTDVTKNGKEVRTLLNYFQVNCPKGIRKADMAEIEWAWMDGKLRIACIRTMGGDTGLVLGDGGLPDGGLPDGGMPNGRMPDGGMPGI